MPTEHQRRVALDVFAEEPLPLTNPFAELPNVTRTAHAGYKTPEASRRLLEMVIDLAARELAALDERGT